MVNKLTDEILEKLLAEYDKSHPKMDELQFVNNICEKYDIENKELFKMIKKIRKK